MGGQGRAAPCHTSAWEHWREAHPPAALRPVSLELHIAQDTKLLGQTGFLGPGGCCDGVFALSGAPGAAVA